MKKLIFVIATLTISVSAFADDEFYGELSLGKLDSDVSYNVSGSIEGESFNESGSENVGDSTVFGLSVGYQFGKYFALELAYKDNGTIKDNYVDDFGDDISESFETKSLNFGLKGILPLTESFSLNARLGLAKWDIDMAATDSSIPDYEFSTSEDGTDIYYGVGAEYAFNDTFSVGLTYTDTTMKWNNDDESFDNNIEYKVSGFSLTGRMVF